MIDCRAEIYLEKMELHVNKPQEMRSDGTVQTTGQIPAVAFLVPVTKRKTRLGLYVTALFIILWFDT